MKNLNLQKEHLTRAEMRVISGGILDGQICKFTLTNSSGFTSTHYLDGFAQGASGSSQANQVCAGMINDGAQRCFYDCAYDGFGQ